MNLSILIPVYGQPKFALAAILSASQYLGVIDEIRVIDDNPADPLISHYPEVLQISERVKYAVNHINLGRTGNYNKLLRECTTDLFLMLDGDDYLADSVDFGEIIQKFTVDPDLVLVCGRCCEVFGEKILKTSSPKMRGKVAGLEYFQAWVGVKNMFPHSACIVKRDAAIRCLGYPSEILNSDIAMIRSVLLVGDALVVDTLVSYWRFHGGNASKLSESDVLLKNFGSILIPYMRGKASKLPVNSWLIQSTQMYLFSAFHQILGAGGPRRLLKYLEFLVCLMRLIVKVNSFAILGILASLPKISGLVLLRLVVGHKRFAQMMARRGNYVYL